MRIFDIEEINLISNSYKDYIYFTCCKCGKDTKMRLKPLKKKTKLFCRECQFSENTKNKDWSSILRKSSKKVDIKKKVEKIKQTKKERYGDPNYCNIEKAKQTAIANNSYKKSAEKRAITNLKKYGNICSLHGKEIHKKVQQSCIKKFGVPSLFVRKRIYYYDKTYFDSSWELRFYVWLKQKNIQFEYQPKIYFTYIQNGKEKKYYPDFKINNRYYEIKGEQFFKNNQPIYILKNESWEEKYQCMKKNKVILLRYFNLKKVFEETKNIDFNQFKIKREAK